MKPTLRRNDDGPGKAVGPVVRQRAKRTRYVDTIIGVRPIAQAVRLALGLPYVLPLRVYLLTYA